MKQESYKNINATSTVDVRDIHLPFKFINGEIIYCDPKTGRLLNADIDKAKAIYRQICSIRNSQTQNY